MRNRTIALFAVVWLAFGQSQAPAPGVIGKTEQQEKADKSTLSKTSNHPPARSAQLLSAPETEKTKPEGSNGAPSPVVVNVNIPKPEINAADWLLTLFTGGLVGLGYFQWRTLKAHHDVMKTSAEAAKSSAETLALQRGVMDTQAGYIGSMLTEINKSAAAAQSSAETAKRALYISQRPLVTVDITMAGGIYEQAFGTSEMDKLTQSFVRFVFRNAGNTVAREFYFAIWITGDLGRHLICDSHRRTMAPGESIEETSKKLVSVLSAMEIAALSVQKAKVCGFVRYKTLFDELPGVYIEFHALWDKSIRQFRISTDEREDGGYPEPS